MGAHSAQAFETQPLTWQVAHAALSRLARERAAADAEEGRWLLAARRSAAHVHLGFGSFGEYVERLFGYQPRSTQEKLRVAEALEELPALERALSKGELSWSALRELTRVAVRETEQQWLELARGKTLRQLEELLAGRRLGDQPSAPPDRSLLRHVLRFEVAAETFALVRDALREIRRRSGAGLDEDAALLELARGALAGPRDEGRASYQVVLSVCPACRGGRQYTDGALVPVSPDVVAMAFCDAQHLGHLDESRPTPANDREPHDVSSPPDKATAHDNAATPDNAAAHTGAPLIESATAAAPTRAREHVAPVEPSSTPLQSAHVGAREWQGIPRATAPSSAHVGGGVKQSLPPVTTRQGAHVGVGAKQSLPPAAGRKNAHVGARAKQDLPPALRRAILLRDQRRCQVPGCRNARYLDLHHLELRSEGGQHSAINVICICGAHHRAAHCGTLLLYRDAAGTLQVRHADGRDYGSATQSRSQAQVQALETHAKVFSALRNLGFREGQVRAVLRELQTDRALREAAFERLLREALAKLRPHCRRR